MPIYKLTSPHMHGRGVKRLQTLLKSNKFDQNFKPGLIDSIYGPATASAVKRAKHDLGYPKRMINNIAGDRLLDYLDGSKKLSTAMLMRRKRRLKRKAELRAMRQRVIKAAVAEARAHVHEEGTSNIVKYSKWYGMIGPWCAMFVTWLFVNHGKSKAFKRGSQWAYCPYIVAAAESHKHGLSITAEPGPGDLVLFDWDNDGVADHIGIFLEWIGGGHHTFKTVEGNTSPENFSNGGQVMIVNDRHKSDVRAFIRVSI